MDMCIDICIEMCVDMRVDMCIDVCVVGGRQVYECYNHKFEMQTAL